MTEIGNAETGDNQRPQSTTSQTKMGQAGSHQNNEEDLEYYPWHAPRVIMHWIGEVWRDERDLWQCWTIDNYDSLGSYVEHQLMAPPEFVGDIEIKGTNFHQLRAHLIQIEAELDGVGEKCEDDQQMTKWRTYNHIKEILMDYYQATLNIEHPYSDRRREPELHKTCEGQEKDEKHSKQVWTHRWQGYLVKDWAAHEGTIDCMWKRTNTRNMKEEEEDDEEDTENLVCAMRGNDWESLPYPIIVDSG